MSLAICQKSEKMLKIWVHPGIKVVESARKLTKFGISPQRLIWVERMRAFVEKMQDDESEQN